jgi:hypothetical protein
LPVKCRTEARINRHAEQHFAGRYTYSNERYELAMSPSGEFLGPPEDAFDASAMCLQ